MPSVGAEINSHNTISFSHFTAIKIIFNLITLILVTSQAELAK